MERLKAYGLRYVGDLVSFTKAYALSSIAILPMAIYIFGAYAMFVYAVLWGAGLANITLFATLTALLDSDLYKFAVYLLAIAANVYALREVLLYDPAPIAAGAVNTNALLFIEIVFLLGLFYFLQKRLRFGPWLRARLDGLGTQKP